MKPRAGLATLIATAACSAACGSAVSVTANNTVAIPPPTLPPGAVPYLPSKVSPITPAKLAREAGNPALRSRLGAWGFVDGADRYFQGESRQLQVVDSRMLRFRSAAGAEQFVAFVRAHVSVYVGAFPGLRGFSSRGRRGILATAQACSCHLANPAFLAVLAGGRAVTWLEINGPGATVARLTQLIATAP